MIVFKKKQNLTIRVTIVDDLGVPITGIAYNDGLFAVSYKTEENTAWTTITLVQGSLGTYNTHGWTSETDGMGNYAFNVPNNSAVPGQRVEWRFTYDTNEPQYGNIDYVGFDESQIPVESDVKFEFQIPGAEPIAVENSNIYIKEKDVVVEFTADQNIEGIPLKVVFEYADNTDFLVVNDGSLTKVGNTVTLTLPNAFTDEIISLNWSIRHQTSLKVYATGNINTAYAPHEDL